jgi:sortase B
MKETKKTETNGIETEEMEQAEIETPKKKKSNFIYNLLLVLFTLIFLGSATYLFLYYYSSKKSEEKVDELKALIIEDTEDETGAGEQAAEEDLFIEIDGVRIQRKFKDLYTRNSNFVGWLTIEGTAVDYPVVQCMENEEYYLRRDFDGEKSTAGTLFVDTSSDLEKPSDNLLIYGHNMKAGTMFHDILQYQDEEFYQNHKYIQFDTIYEDATYEVIAAFKTEIQDVDYEGFKYYQFFDAASQEEFQDYVSNCQRLTGYTTDRTASYGDKLITLSTCSYHADEGRFVVVAVKISE